MEWVLLVCFLIRFMGTFGSMPSFEDLENQTLTYAKSFRRWCGLGKYFEKTGLNYTMLIYQKI
jgi:hypothetical protein